MAKFALILIDGAIPIDGHVYLKNEIAPNPGFGMTDPAEGTKDGILDVEWRQRWVRLYPCFANGNIAYVFRFEGEIYDKA